MNIRTHLLIGALAWACASLASAMPKQGPIVGPVEPRAPITRPPAKPRPAPKPPAVPPFAFPPAPASVQPAVSNAEVAARWAPVIVQGVQAHGKDSENGRSDLIAAVDYDGDWNAKNNWDNVEPGRGYALSATVYYTVARTASHWFITYAVFHPRDWADYGKLRRQGCGWLGVLTAGFSCVPALLAAGIAENDDRHENDMEGLMLVVARPKTTTESATGQLVVMLTVCHHDFLGYTTDHGKATPLNPERGSPQITFNDDGGVARPQVRSEAQTHCISGGGSNGLAEQLAQDQDFELTYRPVPWAVGEPPLNFGNADAQYRLIDMQVLWDQRHNASLFRSGLLNTPGYGMFRGDNGKDDAAAAPWAWAHHGEWGGLMVLDPAELFLLQFQQRQVVSTTYESILFSERPARPCVGAGIPVCIDLK